MVTMNDIIAFVEKVMNTNNVVRFNEFIGDIDIYKNNKIYIKFFQKYPDELIIDSIHGRTSIKISKKDELNYKLLIEKIKEYSAKLAEEDFYNFFDETQIIINDSDND